MVEGSKDAGWFKRAFGDWPTVLLRPVVVSGLSTLVLFLVALAFKPLILDLIHGKPAPGYPILCAAEPYPGTAPDELRADVFIVNRLGNAYSRTDLATALRTIASDGVRSPGPDIVLQIDGTGDFEARADADFNGDKGRLIVDTDRSSRTVRIVIDRISPRAILKVVVSVRGLHFVAPDLSRTAKGQLRFDFAPYLDGCYAK